MSSFRDKLTEDDMKDLSLWPTLVENLEEFRMHLGLQRSEFKVLDWGCGRGRTVLLLKEEGYAAFGADVDTSILDRGKDLFRKRGLDPEQLLKQIDEDGRTSWPNEFFHFVFSEQVFEHVENMDKVASEMNRVSKLGSKGLHSFPPHKGIIETHLFMPFVHWLPKNRIRKYYILLFVLLGFGPKYLTDKEQSVLEKTEIYYRGNITNSFYRHYRTIQRCLDKHRFDVEFIPIKNSRVQKVPFLKKMARIPLLHSLINCFFLTFRGVSLMTTKRESVQGGTNDHSMECPLRRRMRQKAPDARC